MKDRELIVTLQQQNATLLESLNSLAKTIESQSQELSALKAIILEKDAAAIKAQQFANINLPKKTEKRKAFKKNKEE